MPRERPPTTDAEFRIVHGPWPRWVLQFSLFKLVAWGALCTGVAIVIGLLLLAAFGAFG
jgi:hypothetical protein